MRQRLVTSAVGLGVFAAVMIFYSTLIVNIAIAVISAVAVHEVLLAAGCLKHKSFSVLCILFAVSIPFVSTALVGRLLPVLCYLFVVLVFIVLLRNHAALHVEKVGFVFMMTLAAPLSFNCIVFIRDSWFPALGIYYILIIFGSAWWGDSGAFFAGRLFGRHKLAPVVSPKKTVEGLLGGLATVVLGNLLVSWVFMSLQRYGWFLAYGGGTFDINYWYVAAVSPLLAVNGVLGDLSASVIKRQYGIKDFGSLMPGHGGVMDRFDSVLFVAPVVYILARFFPFATKL